MSSKNFATWGIDEPFLPVEMDFLRSPRNPVKAFNLNFMKKFINTRHLYFEDTRIALFPNVIPGCPYYQLPQSFRVRMNSHIPTKTKQKTLTKPILHHPKILSQTLLATLHVTKLWSHDSTLSSQHGHNIESNSIPLLSSSTRTGILPCKTLYTKTFTFLEQVYSKVYLGSHFPHGHMSSTIETSL